MPQMSPMWWTMLMIMFLMTFFMFNMMIYFMKMEEGTKEENIKIHTKSMNWKW
uniref:ATP synthase complex subunit 8 n=1 Tax=Notonectidae sp. MT-2014 TaxID=1560018 RepID=A0A0A0VG17_9HEMI|nr:ATP synthase F0 subunit 8 [Notonectidae sp. MT-2014]